MTSFFTLMKSKRMSLCLLIILFLFNTLHTQAQMRQVYLDIPANNISDISFYSPSNGYVAFKNWIGATADSGRTFTKKYITTGNVNFGSYTVNTAFSFAINGVKAISQDTIVVYGDYGFEPSILYSVNGGTSYTLVYHTNLIPNVFGGLNDMVFPQNNSTGYAIDNHKILKTTDKGNNWTVVLNDPTLIFALLDGIDNNNLFAYSGNNTNKLFKTSNGGISWQQITLPAGSVVSGDFITVNKGWLYMVNGGQYNFYYTANGGVSWSMKDNTAVPFSQLAKMQFTNDSTGYVIAGGFSIYKSTDSGKIWEPLPRDNNYSGTYNLGHIDFQCYSNNQLWAGGENGFLELSTNGGGATLPKAYFKIDTAGVYNTNTVSLKNYSKTTYQYQWFKNGTLISTAYNASYAANFFHPYDTIKLAVSSGVYTDTLIKYQLLTLHPPTPVISSFTPTSGSIATVVTITGSNFSGATAVNFGGTPASSFIVNSATSITATVAGGSTGSVSVTTQYGTATLTGFIYNSPPPPVITSFTPASGAAGTTVTIIGANFNPIATNNIVYFGASRATVQSASATQLVVLVPTGATYKPITVLNSYTQLAGFSNRPFLVTFPGGGGSFTTASFEKVVAATPVAPWFTLSQAADFNDDGKPDGVISSGTTGRNFTVYQNTGTIGTFSFIPAGTYLTESTGVNVRDFGIADIDGDGKLDIIATRDSNFNAISTVSIFRNTSTGGNITFAPKVDIAGENSQYGISIADLDGDGKPEIVASRGGTNNPNPAHRFVYFKNNSTPGNIVFATVVNVDPAPLGSRNIEVKDIDADNKPDVILTVSDSTFFIYKNTSVNGNINFDTKIVYKTAAKYPNYICVGDLDGDDKPDLIVSDLYDINFSTFRNTGTPGIISFAPKVDFSTPGVGGGRLDIGDLNGDGKLDVSSSGVSICNNLSTPGNILFAPAVNYSIYTGDECLADFDGDGKLDMGQLGWSQDNKINVYKNKFAGSLAYAGPDASICAVGTIQLGGTSVTANTYSWTSNPSGFISSIANPFVSPVVTTSYYLTVSNGTTTASDTVIITVNPVPVANAGADKTVCAFANTIIGTAATGSNSYGWASNPVGFTSSTANPTVAPAITTNYYLTVTNSFGCTAKDTVIVNISSPVANAGIDKTVCPGGSTSIGIAATGDTYSWVSNPVGFTSSVSNPVVTPAITTGYFLTVTNSLGCFAKDTTVVTVAAPVANAGIDKTICAGNTTSIGAAAIGNYTYSWSSNPAGFISTAAIPNVSPTVTTSYFLTVSNGNCSTNDTVIVTVNTAAIPAVTISSSNTSICTGTAATFTASPVNGGSSPSYQWQVNGINSGTNNSIFTTSALTNNAQVKVILTSSLSCAAPLSATSNVITISVIAPPIANAGNNTSVCAGSNVQLNGSGGTSYVWSPATGLNNPNIANPIASPAVTTSYILTVSNAATCSSKDTVIVTVNPPQTPTVTATAAVNNICAGSTATFTANAINGGSGPSYQWLVNGINAGTNNSLFTTTSINNNDQVKVILTSNASCITSATATSNTITMTVQAQLTTPVVSLNNRVFTITNPEAGVTYTWQIMTNNGWANIAPAATGITYTATAAGEYRVMGVKGSCISYSSSQVTSLVALQPSGNAFGINLYPNPSSNIVILDSIKLNQNWETIKIINADGQHVLPLINIKNQTTVSINVSGLKQGTYFIQLRKKDGEFTTIKFVKI